jgi:hypothetical protein
MSDVEREHRGNDGQEQQQEETEQQQEEEEEEELGDDEEDDGEDDDDDDDNDEEEEETEESCDEEEGVEDLLEQIRRDHPAAVPSLHPAVLAGIVRLADPRYRKVRHGLVVDTGFVNGMVNAPKPVDESSLQHLVDFLDNVDSHEVAITELQLVRIMEFGELCGCGAFGRDDFFNVLIDFFERSDTTTLTKVTLWNCDFGSQEDASRLFAGFHTNRTVTDLTISQIHNLHGTAHGNSLCLV